MTEEIQRICKYHTLQAGFRKKNGLGGSALGANFVRYKNLYLGGGGEGAEING